MSEPERVHHLPLHSLGFANTPAVPYWPSAYELLKTLLLLALRAVETEPAKRGLSVPYTIDDQTHPAYDFLYGGASSLSQAIKRWRGSSRQILRRFSSRSPTDPRSAPLVSQVPRRRRR